MSDTAFDPRYATFQAALMHLRKEMEEKNVRAFHTVDPVTRMHRIDLYEDTGKVLNGPKLADATSDNPHDAIVRAMGKIKDSNRTLAKGASYADKEAEIERLRAELAAAKAAMEPEPVAPEPEDKGKKATASK
jgi:hypothetical protein